MKPLILLVEGPGADRSLQALALESQGWEVPQAVDVGEALAWLEKGRPDLVVVGGSVEGVGSLEPLCRKLEASGTPLRVLASPAEQEVLRRQGVRPEAFLARPLTLGALVDRLRAALPPHEPPPVDWRRPLVLIADDDPVGRKLLQLHLAPFRFEVLTASDGRAALDLALRRQPDLVIADVLMPRLDGFRLCVELRNEPRMARVPVLLAHAIAPNELDLRMAQNVGANGFVSRTQTGDEVMGALLRELRNGGPAPLAPSLAELPTDEHLHRMVRQLERQVGLLAQAERAARESEERYRLVVAGSYDGVWDWDLRRNTLWLSPRLLELLGLSGQAWAGTYEAFLERVHPEDREGLEAALTAHLERDVPYDVAYRVLHATGGYRHCVARGRALRDAHGQPTRMAGILGDITEQLRLYRDAQEAVRARDEFLTVAAHELRTPLTTLRLRLQGLGSSVRAEGVLSADKAARALEAADRQVQRLSSLVESLLDVSQLQGHAPRLHVEETDLSGVVREAVSRSEEAAARAGCPLVLGELPPTPGHWDAARLSQVVMHLLSNAVKFGPGKPVEVELRNRADAAVLVVRDHGIGIAPERVEGLFQRFERAVPLRHYGGLGLGLYRVRRIVEAHGGFIRVESLPGEGSSFVITLPRRGPGN